MKSLLLQTLILLSFICLTKKAYSQNCFYSDMDVVTYAHYKTFTSKDKSMSMTFNPSTATFKSGSNSYTYIYEKYTNMNGQRGKIILTNTSTGGQLSLDINCKFGYCINDGVQLFYRGADNDNTSNFEKIAGLNEAYSSPKKSATRDVLITRSGGRESGMLVKIGLPEMTKEEAKKTCSNFGPYWRLPKEDEWGSYKNYNLRDHSVELELDENKLYWCSDSGPKEGLSFVYSPKEYMTTFVQTENFQRLPNGELRKQYTKCSVVCVQPKY